VPDVVVVGDANVDLVLRGDVVPRFAQAEQLLDAADFTLGGSGAIVACGVARLGYDVTLIAAVGDDTMGTMVLDALRECGVSTEHVVRRPSHATGISVILGGTDRAILTYAGAIATLSAADIDPAILSSARHLHSASPYLTPILAPDLPRLLQAARESGTTVSVDTNDDPSRLWKGIADLLSAADAALPNEGELMAWSTILTGTAGNGWRETATAVTAYVPQIVVKRGAAGAGMATRGAGFLDQSGPAIEIVDTTGAGDSFDAGWIGAILDGADSATALRWAVAAGRLSTSQPGGTGGQGNRAEVATAADALSISP
jgi:sugar/nucleoside kinase (ribokinase family)